MKWVKVDKTQKIPIKSWCEDVEAGAIEQAQNLASHPVIIKHVALMPDCHQGYGMPIGGVIGCRDAVIPNAVGVDIGCGMGAVETDYRAKKVEKMAQIRSLFNLLKEQIPVGEGHAHKQPQEWDGFSSYLESIGVISEIDNFENTALPGWLTEKVWSLATRNLGTLGGGNHFIELQKSENGYLWLMLHSGSRNLGYQIASHYHKKAVKLNEQFHAEIPNSSLAFLPVSSEQGKAYIRDMNFALAYAQENRHRMMSVFKKTTAKVFEGMEFKQEINIHHNYAALENHFGENLWVHRKGATSAKKNEMGIIPGSMGTASYIVKGLGNRDSFMSCSHGAGRNMSRTAASERLSVEQCDKAMKGIVFDRWKRAKKHGNKGSKKSLDLSEAPMAYKDIDEVIASELDLIEPVVKLSPLGVLKG